MAKTKTGRPTICNPEIVAEICRHVLNGVSMKTAAGSVGIDYSTLKRWRAWQREGKEPFAALCAPLKVAVAQARGKAEGRVYAGKAGWQASARWLESMDANLWRRTERREITQTTDIRVAWPDLAKATPEALARRSAAIDEALKKPGRN